MSVPYTAVSTLQLQTAPVVSALIREGSFYVKVFRLRRNYKEYHIHVVYIILFCVCGLQLERM